MKVIKKISGCQKLGEVEGGMNRQSTGNFWSSEIILYDTVMCTYNTFIHLSKLIEYTAQRVNSNINYELQLIIMYQYGLINCKNVHTNVRFNSKENYAQGRK